MVRSCRAVGFDFHGCLGLPTREIVDGLPDLGRFSTFIGGLNIFELPFDVQYLIWLVEYCRAKAADAAFIASRVAYVRYRL